MSAGCNNNSNIGQVCKNSTKATFNYIKSRNYPLFSSSKRMTVRVVRKINLPAISVMFCFLFAFCIVIEIFEGVAKNKGEFYL